MSESFTVRAKEVSRQLAPPAALLLALTLAPVAPGQANVAKPSRAAPACIHPTNVAKAAVTGLDVSKWQGEIHFRRLPSSVRYVFVRATHGASGVDRAYGANIRGARDAGLAVGTYHYYLPGKGAPDQFRHFVTHASVAAGDLPPVVDIEVMNGQHDAGLAAELAAFLTLLESHYGARPIIYAGRDFANRHLKGFGAYPLWLAEYRDSAAPVLPLDWKRWTFWQKSQSGLVEGIQGCVDLDSFNGEAGQFEALLLKARALRPALATAPPR